MYSECEASFRLTYKEILYLAASIGAEEIYGLRKRHQHQSNQDVSEAAEAELLKQSLLEKKLLKEKDGKIVLTADLYEVIRTLTHPKLFFVARSKEDLLDISRNYYIAGHIAVRLEYDTVNHSAYELTRYDNDELLKENLQSFFQFSVKGNIASEQSVCLGIEELKDFLQAITNNDNEKKLAILDRKGLDKPYAEDIARALEEKACLKTMLIISFDGASKSIIKEYIIYGGGEYLWQIEFRDTKVKISSITNDAIHYRMSVLADVLYYL